MVFARVADVLHVPNRDPWVHKVVTLCNEMVPFMVLGHRHWARPKLIYSIIRRVCFPFEDAGVGIVSFLDLANDNGLELAAGVLKVQVCLEPFLVQYWIQPSQWAKLTLCK